MLHTSRTPGRHEPALRPEESRLLSLRKLGELVPDQGRHLSDRFPTSRPRLFRNTELPFSPYIASAMVGARGRAGRTITNLQRVGVSLTLPVPARHPKRRSNRNS